MADEKVDAGIASPGTPDAWRIAELEREVRELRRTNKALRICVARQFELDSDVTAAERAAAGTGVTNGVTNGVPNGVLKGPANAGNNAAAAHGRAEDAQWATQRSPHSPAPRPTVAFRALGPIEAAVGGRLVDLGAPKQRALLALLVSKVGRPTAFDVIVEELWTGHPPPAAVSSLHAYVANLRRVLEPGRAPRTQPTVLRTYGRGYLLDSRAVEVDVHRFSERAVAGWQALDRGDPHSAVNEFEGALALWRGPAYAEVADTDYVRPDVARLEELRLSVVEGRCAALLAAGAHEIAAAELEAFVQDHPLREYGCELLSLALYRAGRQVDALAVLRTNQRWLAEELGIDPRPALQLLEEQILNHAPSLDWRPHPRPDTKPARRPATLPDQRAPHWSARRQPAPHGLLPRGDVRRSPLPAEL
ncbi:AfsR/SARP family transcriptional regulator [Streptomyces rishiriensis]|uniref:DNA-binding SARP family transcriptional activator n=1 Tax=Streptomyces rishiriensis TaxID=68264 RepID=A0ABU0P372_STRRH|nr:AfsR/SARP family transcriptional regulator [Streptomyces rishiriensis]MDQ0585847.1 DNA-binding SARP family transcriptional activator [Streptomyces rishiriensis]